MRVHALKCYSVHMELEGQLSAHSPPTMRVLGLGLRRWDRWQVPLAAAELPPRALCRVSFLLFTSLRPVFFEEFWDCFSLPPFWDKVLNNPRWSRSQKLGPKVIKYWSHLCDLASYLGFPLLPLSSCSFLVVRQRWFVVHQRWFVARVSGSHRRLCPRLYPDHHLSIITCRASLQSRFLLTHFVYDPEKTPIVFMALVETERNQERLYLQPFPKQSGTGYNCNISET